MKKTFAYTSLIFSTAIGNAEEEVTIADEIAYEMVFPKAEPPVFTRDTPLPTYEPKRKSPFIAVGLSSLVPGLGHVYLGEYATGVSLFGSSSLLFGYGTGGEVWETNQWRLASLDSFINTWRYNIYAAYRDVRRFNSQEGYLFSMPQESLFELASAPFQWNILKKREVWGGYLGALALAATTIVLSEKYGVKQTAVALSDTAEVSSFPLVAFPVGIGEEAFFRGYMQPMLSEQLRSKAGGLALTSLLFGAAHISNAELLEPHEKQNYYTFSIPLITTLGAYFGWMASKNNSLKEGVAVHSWYDFTLFLVGYLAESASSRRGTGFSVSIPF